PRHAALDPGRYHQSLLERGLAAGVTVAPHTPVTGIERLGDGFRVATPRGDGRGRDVVLGTDVFTGESTAWQRRRIIPIGSYIIATEPLPPALIAELFPTDRTVTDTRRVVYYYRLSPDRQRVLFGGRVSANETDPRASAPLLRAELVRLFPQLRDVQVSHSWMGFVGYTFDALAHAGRQEGMHYAMGYCGSGIAIASYLGMRTGQKILGRSEGRTGFDDTSFETRPLYGGKPWFLGATVAYYRWRDRLGF